MRKFRRICIALAVFFVATGVVANLVLLYTMNPSAGSFFDRPYRVDIERISRAIEEGQSYDLSNYPAIIQISVLEETSPSEFSSDQEEFFDDENSYIIRQIDGKIYKFSYEDRKEGITPAFVLLNVIILVVMAATMGTLVFIYVRILRPFHILSDVPYELSKGNLTVPLKDNGNRFFGRFIWGVDLLREKLEKQKATELNMQREKKTLLLSLSHDIKTPLSAIKLYSKALSKNLYQNTEKQKEIADNINDKADEIEYYVSQIISASREDFLSFDVEISEFYLSELVNAVNNYYSEKFDLNKTIFTIEEYSDCILKGDLNRSIEVIQNLLENTIKYGDGNRVDISFAQEENCILVTVTNTGADLPIDETVHLFDSFYRGSNASNKPGSGLGLYICKSLMTRMNGDIYAQIEGGIMKVTAVFNKA
jgi:signal transduction histidine kinase